MAEGWARSLADGKISVSSAGLHPCGVSPRAVKSMHEAGVDISTQSSRMLDKNLLEWAGAVITLCDTVKPISSQIPDSAIYLHWSIPNPDALVTEVTDYDEAYDRVRDQIRFRVEEFLREHQLI
jgi:arsenate reductase